MRTADVTYVSPTFKSNTYTFRSYRTTMVQNALIRKGLSFTGGADGIFGPATHDAVIRFQTSQGLPATRVVDAATTAPTTAAAAPSCISTTTSTTTLDSTTTASTTTTTVADSTTTTLPPCP